MVKTEHERNNTSSDDKRNNAEMKEIVLLTYPLQTVEKYDKLAKIASFNIQFLAQT